jgi:tRNA-splicing ligase RtcB (3'-phosphate/5'-hydroxy nucleic acid ligase)
MIHRNALQRLHHDLWEIPVTARRGMRVPARVYASESMLDAILGDRSLEQLVNVTMLPGIRKYAVVMPDAHEGYGFPIGGVAAFDPEEGIISPGGIGYDINCGVRLLRSELLLDEIDSRLPELARSLAREIPSGTGGGGTLRLQDVDLDAVLSRGAERIVEIGLGMELDLDRIESGGRMSGADAAFVSERAKERGRGQLGSMGSGNHFVEIDVVESVHDAIEAARLHLHHGQIVIQIHTGSRGLGHQIATDSLRIMSRAMRKYGITVPDRELACVPFRSEEGQQYFGAMAAGANFAFANRQAITAAARGVWTDALGKAGGQLELVYDVAHNVAKLEEHEVNGRSQWLVVHRKGATRAFPGQPVLIPGSMGTASWVLAGRDKAMMETFGSSCHGAGRAMSRSRAKREIDSGELRSRLASRGIVVESGSVKGLIEEAPEAYKDVDSVVEVVHRAGIASKVARLRPLAVIKG